MEKYYKITNTDLQYNDVDESKVALEKILYYEINYNYFDNKNKTYSLLEVEYDEKIDEYIYTEVLFPISVKEFKEMDYQEKENYFQR